MESNKIMAIDRNIDPPCNVQAPITASGVRKIPVHREVIYTLILLTLTYAVVETIASALFLHGIIEPQSLWVQENTGNGSTIQFDPIRGYRLSSISSRMAVVASNGTVESVGVVRGNNEGFPDRDDFTQKRRYPKGKRFAVFGDSFTSAQFIARNWPDVAEDLSRDTDIPLELLNFSVDGGGIVNWWSTLTRILEPEGYEIDGVIFAVCCNDLKRGFAILDDQFTFSGSEGIPRMMYGRVPTYDPISLPTNWEEALQYVKPLPPWETISTVHLDRVIEGEFRIPFQRPFQLYIAQRVRGSVRQLLNLDNLAMISSDIPVNQATDLEEPSQPFPFNTSPRFDGGRRRLVDDIRRFLKSNRIPSIVVHVPEREELLEGTDPPEEHQDFAAVLQADFVDGSLAFKGLTQREIRASWLPYDGHWGQGGSDLFAQLMVEVLANWPSSKSESF